MCKRFIPLLCVSLFVFLSVSAFAGIEERISMDFRDADIRDVCKIMTEKGGLGLVMEKSVRGNVTVRFKDQTVEECLNLLLAANGFDWELQEKTVVVADEMKVPARIIHRKLVFARPADIARILTMTIKKDLKVATDEAQNALVLTARQKILVQAEKLLKELDNPVPFFSAFVTLSQGKEKLNEGTFQVKFGEEARFSTSIPLNNPRETEATTATAATGLDLKISPRRMLSPTEVECDLTCNVNLLKKGNAPVPVIVSDKLVSTYRIPLGKPIVIDMGLEETKAFVTLSLELVK